MIPFQEYKRGLAVIRNSFLGLSGLAFIIQRYVDSSTENILSALLCLAALVPACFLIISPRSERGGASLTGAAVFMSIASNSLIPLIFTLLEGHSVVFSLKFPVQVFGHRLLFAGALLAAHFLACSIVGRSAKNGLGGIFDFLGLRWKLHPTQLWVAGGIGMLILLILRISGLSEGVLVKVLQPMVFLATFPFLLLVPPYTQYLKRKRWMFVPLVALFIMNVSLGVTSRLTMVLPIAMVLGAYFMAILARQARLPRVNPITAIVAVVAGLLLAPQMIDFSEAILIERTYRAERSIGQSLTATIDTFLNKDKLKKSKIDKLSEMEGIEAHYGAMWKEDYIDNPFAARFTTIKADDNLFNSIQNYTEKDFRMVKAVTVEKIYAQFPAPIIKIFGIQVDKEFISSFSMGDFMDILTNRMGALGGFRTGSMVVHSFVCFGWWYPLFLSLLLGALFIVFQTMSVLRGGGAASRGISTFALAYGFTLYLGFAVEGCHVIAGLLVRGIWQLLLLYGISMWIISILIPHQRRRKERRSRVRRAITLPGRDAPLVLAQSSGEQSSGRVHTASE